MKSIIKILFPLYFNSKIKLTNNQKQEIEKIDREIGLCGEEFIFLEYEMKCNRSIGIDRIIQSISIISIVTIIILILKYIL